jgi:hypothetical protein
MGVGRRVIYQIIRNIVVRLIKSSSCILGGNLFGQTVGNIKELDRENRFTHLRRSQVKCPELFPGP